MVFQVLSDAWSGAGAMRWLDSYQLSLQLFPVVVSACTQHGIGGKIVMLSVARLFLGADVPGRYHEEVISCFWKWSGLLVEGGGSRSLFQRQGD